MVLDARVCGSVGSCPVYHMARPKGRAFVFLEPLSAPLPKQKRTGRVQSAHPLGHERVQKCPCAIEAQHTAVASTIHIEISVPPELQHSRIAYGAGPRRHKNVNESPANSVVA